MIPQLNAIRHLMLNARDAAQGTHAVAPIDRAIEEVDDLLLLCVKGDNGTTPDLFLVDMARDIALAPYALRSMAVVS